MKKRTVEDRVNAKLRATAAALQGMTVARPASDGFDVTADRPPSRVKRWDNGSAAKLRAEFGEPIFYILAGPGDVQLVPASLLKPADHVLGVAAQ